MSFVLRTGIRLSLLQLNSKDGFRGQCVSVLGLKSTKSQAWFGNTRQFETESLWSLWFSRSRCIFKCFVSCESHGLLFVNSICTCLPNNKHAASNLSSFLPRLLLKKTTRGSWRNESVNLASTWCLLISSKVKSGSQLDLVPPALASEVSDVLRTGLPSLS